jgi:hypothetical protein
LEVISLRSWLRHWTFEAPCYSLVTVSRRRLALAATAFFSRVSARYERGSILLTSNKGFGEWGEVLGDPVIATAILDRLLHHSHILNIRGESYRLREKKQAGLLGVSLAPGPAPGPADEDATPSTRPGMGQFSTGDSGSRVRRR